jgi:hypothetical protein
MKTNPILLALMEVSLLLPSSLGAAQFCTNVASESYLVPGTINLSALPPATQIFRYQGGFTAYIFDDLAGEWTPSYPAHRPGEGFLIETAYNATFCFPEPTQSPVLPLPLHPGINLLCCQSNVPATYEDIVGAGPAPGTRLYRLKKGGGEPFPIPIFGTNWVSYLYLSSGWSPTTPIAAAGEAIIVYINPFIQNETIVNGTMEFDVYSPAGYQVTIETTDSLTAPQWQTLTMFTPGSGVTHVSDPDPINAHAERYYRARL